MISAMLSTFKSFSDSTGCVQRLEDLIESFASDLIKDGNARDALIDDICQHLQSLKSTNATSQGKSS